MSEFELLRYIAIGQYLPTGSFLHRLDPRVKLTGVVLVMPALMLQTGPAGALAGLLLLLLLLLLARAPMGHIVRSLRPLRGFFVIVLILQILLYPHRQAIAEGSLVLLDWGPIVVSGAAVPALAAILLRIVSIVLLLTLLSTIADVTDLTHGVEGLLRPFQRLGLPAHELSLVLVITLRFVPLLGRELERLIKAQVSRGADFGRGRGWFWQRVRKIFPLLIPLFITALRRAEELSIAMEARGYGGGKGRTHLVRLHLRPADGLALIFVVGLSAGLVLVNLGPLERALALWLRRLFTGVS